MMEHKVALLRTREYWQAIEQCKMDFVYNNIDPLSNVAIRREVAESWMRSKQNGVKLDTDHLKYKMTYRQITDIKEKNKLLIEFAEPIIQKFIESDAASPNRSLELYDIHGIFISGTHVKLTDDKIESLIWNEKTTGTTAHDLAILHKKPYQLIGPENYLMIIKNTVCTSAPIINEEGVVLGTLDYVQILGENPWDEYAFEKYSQSMAWVCSMVMAIEEQIKIHKRNVSLREINEKLRKTSEALRITLDFFDEGVITTDAEGIISRVNKEGCKMLKAERSFLEGRNIAEFLQRGSVIPDCLAEKRSVDYIEENIHVNDEVQPYLLSIRPVLKPETTELDFAILRLDYADKINALVAARSGAVAKFRFEDIIGHSESVVRAKKMAQRFAESQENILLLGESGTDKEIFAQAIHNQLYPNRPFITLNCAAMPRNLIESELFGYESGVLTGAEKNGRPGKIELANGGTLFLDEIGEMPYEIQAAIMRVLNDKMVMRLGGKQYRHVQFRLITATSHDLTELAKKKAFREDFYFLLSVLYIEIPPLRERMDDIPLLADYFIEQYTTRMGFKVPRMTQAARMKLLEYDWPGNVRQLENAMIYAVNLAEDQVIDIHHLPKEVLQMKDNEGYWPKSTQSKENTQAAHFSIKDSEKDVILHALDSAGNNIAAAAKLLGVNKTTLYRKLKKHAIQYQQK
ncbi:sigma 54-interacting transcriptional regulator [Dehalobacter sp. DCM]|uniref:sigma 54-interacting transcriptional regulator n=1 Tax=Dehalobacter sp. DCM TaxID=2907827 RepID=UPI003081E575|nr:sigma 54-interacting transcriptional regulator [Dehalobacter sp. DCM]